MRRVALAFALLVVPAVVVGCMPADPAAGSGDAAATGSGGTAAGTGGRVAASGGATGSGGAVGSGGTTATGTGGQLGEGGTTTATGGSQGMGGGAGRGAGGGTGGNGGVSATGGGGGGRGGTGGAGTAGRGSGGTGTGSGGAGTGGRGTGGAGTGGAATGGSPPTSCNLPNHSGMGSYTFYYFGQGTARDGSGYRTACGYYGTQSGSSASGPNDTVPNAASVSPANTKYFAAIPGNNGFDSKAHCGECVQVTGQNGKSVIATIIDECPYGSDGGNTVCGNNAGGHLDLSTAAFDAIGPFTNSQGATIGNPTNTTWRFVPCPISGNVILQIKAGNDNEFFIQNTILAVKSVNRGGSENAVHQSYGAWHFGTKLNVGDTLNLTDTLNRTLAIQVGNTTMGQNQDTGRQFPACQ